MLTINGESMDAAGKPLADFLREAGYDPARVAVERNLEIVPAEQFPTTILQDGDSIEIVHFVQGG